MRKMNEDLVESWKSPTWFEVTKFSRVKERKMDKRKTWERGLLFVYLRLKHFNNKETNKMLRILWNGMQKYGILCRAHKEIKENHIELLTPVTCMCFFYGIWEDLRSDFLSLAHAFPLQSSLLLLFFLFWTTQNLYNMEKCIQWKYYGNCSHFSFNRMLHEQ